MEVRYIMIQLLAAVNMCILNLTTGYWKKTNYHYQATDTLAPESYLFLFL